MTADETRDLVNNANREQLESMLQRVEDLLRNFKPEERLPEVPAKKVAADV